MKILMCHNFYQQPGGEDRVFADEAALLEQRGHDVVRFTVHNDVIEGMSRLQVARRTIWNNESYRQLRALMRRERPALAHFTNTFPLISPAAYYAARAEGVAVVQSLHNYRLFCVNSCFQRNEQICEDCLGRTFALPGVLHGCYRGSRAGSAVVALAQTYHRLRRTWSRMVDRYIALTEFARQKCIEGGLPEDRLVVKPNFVSPDPGPAAGGGGYALFVGRLSPEKGITTLLDAWKDNSLLPLKIAGDGPLGSLVRDYCAGSSNVEWLGAVSAENVQQRMGEARFLVVPSTWYEVLPKTVVEAYSRGTPVVASRLGSLASLVNDGVTGLLFDPANSTDLAAKVRALNGKHLPAMRRNARAEYENKYTADANYRVLMHVYTQAVACAKRHAIVTGETPADTSCGVEETALQEELQEDRRQPAGDRSSLNETLPVKGIA